MDKRTKYCGEFTVDDIGKQAVACGWVQKVHDKGMLVFIDLRDRTGILQLAFDDQTDPELRAKAQTPRAEFVLMAKGTIRRRSPPAKLNFMSRTCGFSAGARPRRLRSPRPPGSMRNCG